MNDIMLDIETLGSSSNAAIIAIGAVQFDPITGKTGAEFECIIDIESAEQYGDIDGSTVKWWLNQSPEAREIFKNKNRISFKRALLEFNDWLIENTVYKKRNIWGNGATFDPVVLSNAYQKIGLEQPWPFWGVRDVRTIVDAGRRIFNIDPKTSIKIEGPAHNALNDARHQAIYVSNIYQHMFKTQFKEVA